MAASKVCVIVFSVFSVVTAAKSIDKIIFEEQRIEGKIRRPQLVMIKAEQRPDFVPLVLKSAGKTAHLSRTVNWEVLEESPWDKAFRIQSSTVVRQDP